MVQRILSEGVWRQLFQITDNTNEQLALEVLATFELSQCMIAFHCGNYIQLQVFGAQQQMGLMEFSVKLGLYDVEFTITTAYDALLTSRLAGEWQRRPCND